VAKPNREEHILCSLAKRREERAVNETDQAGDSKAAKVRLPKVRLALLAAFATLLFVLAYKALIQAMPGMVAVSTFYVLAGGLVWAVAKLVHARRRARS
jgi:hypothetical protein